MPKNEDGEFELTLGNRQLLSVFFIVVILLGVFFTMGYIVGRNSAPVTADNIPPHREPSGKPLEVESPTSDVPAPVAANANPPEPAKVPEPIRTEPAKTAPAAESKPETKADTKAEAKAEAKREKAEEKKAAEAKAEAAKAEAKQKREEKRAEEKHAAEEKKAAEKKSAEKKAETKSEAKAEKQPGAGQSYLQLAATTKREADVMIDVLKQKGFQAVAAEIPEKAGTFRVLVGPIADGTTNKIRSDLQGAGFPGNAAIRRTF